MKHLFNFLCLFIFLLGGSLMAQNQQKLPYKDASLSIELRVHDLLGRMTLEEKCSQVDIWHPRTLNAANRAIFDACLDSLGDYINQGIGFLQFITQTEHGEYAASYNAIQKYFVEETRLGIPAISNSEGCHGFMGYEGTVFPTPMCMGSTWNTQLVEEIYSAIGKEMRLYGITHAATPVIDLLRDPRYGRSEEMFGEDPYHVGEMAVASVFGFQGRDNKIVGERLIACAKHFGASSEPEGGTNISPANISERVLRETHFYPFEQVVKRANIRTVMASYNDIDGVPSHGNSWLLNDILRGEWGFTGFVISDFDGVGRMVYEQFVVPDQAGAAKRAIESGMDFECPQNREKYCFKHLPALVRAGELKESVIDSAVARVLRTKFEMGMFEHPYVVPVSASDRKVYQEEHRKLALKAAEEGMVLLKNENNLLPFNAAEIKHLAVIGPNADEVHYGNYSNDATPGISILEGLTKFGDGKFEVHYAEGFKLYENDNTITDADKTPEAEERRINEALELVKRCDAVLLVMGESELTCREGWGEDRTGDRVGLELLGRQNDLAKAILATGKKTAVLLINGRPLAVNYLAENAPAIIEGWYLGQEQGTAVANVIFGKVNPSGKLTATIPRSVGHLPVYYNHKPVVHQRSFVEGSYSPLFPFGLGLSYTQFKYSNLKLSSASTTVGQPVVVTVEVTNTGDRDGVEVVQLYIRDKVSSVTRPVKELKDFERIALAKGETKTVKFTITNDKLQFYNLDMMRVVEPGEFEVMVGTNSVDYLSDRFVLTSN